jgi:hypothetical protein
MNRIEKIKKALKQDMINHNKGICTWFYTQDEINAIDNLSDDFVLMQGRLLNIK